MIIEIILNHIGGKMISIITTVSKLRTAAGLVSLSKSNNQYAAPTIGSIGMIAIGCICYSIRGISFIANDIKERIRYHETKD
jgi:hypothetical protein